MHSSNFVVDITPDFEDIHYRIRAIDFDQQCYEGKFSVYRPQFFKENFPIMKLVRKRLNHDAIIQYKIEERSIVAKRLISYENRISKLIKEMKGLTLSTEANLENLKKEIFQFTQDPKFNACTSMGDVMDAAFDFVRNNYENLSLNKLF